MEKTKRNSEHLGRKKEGNPLEAREHILTVVIVDYDSKYHCLPRGKDTSRIGEKGWNLAGGKRAEKKKRVKL